MTDTEAPRRRRTSSADRASRRGRRQRASGDPLVADLIENVDRLLAENRDLKRQLARLQRSSGTGDLGQSARTLAGLQRRVSRALGNASGGRQARTQPRRKVTDPDVLEKRRAALAKAPGVREAPPLDSTVGDGRPMAMQVPYGWGRAQSALSGARGARLAWDSAATYRRPGWAVQLPTDLDELVPSLTLSRCPSRSQVG